MRTSRMAALLLFGGASCSSVEVDSNSVVRGITVPADLADPATKSDLDAIAAHNYEFLKRQYGPEWECNHGDKLAPPEKGIALSGGGMRSAAFCMGVLRALQESRQLGDVDCMSSVSGGGYTLSWYYLQQFAEKNANDATRDEMFDLSGRFQQYLEDHGRLLSRLPFSSTYYLALGEDWLENVLFIPVNLFCNGVFAWHTNTTPTRLSYENGIERAFQVHTTRNGSTDNAATYLLVADFGVDEPMSCERLGAFVRANALPSFIVNTTAVIDDNHDHLGAPLRNSVFEFTPFHFGSDAFGYGPKQPATAAEISAGETKYPITFNRSIAVSGAAADSSEESVAAKKVIDSALNFDLGYNVENYGASIPWWNPLLPFPFYLWFGETQWDKRGTDIHLIDGGQSDNLGAFSLLRRGCRQIVIVDAEYDPDYVFEAYRRLKRAVREELGMTLSVPEIDRSLVARNLLPDDLDLDAVGVQKAGPAFSGAAPISVMKGWARYLPIARPAQPVDLRVITVKYVKLSMDAKNLGAYSPSVRNYYTGHSTAFPQQSTIDQNFEPSQFRAYRELGYDLAKNAKLAWD